MIHALTSATAGVLISERSEQRALFTGENAAALKKRLADITGVDYLVDRVGQAISANDPEKQLRTLFLVELLSLGSDNSHPSDSQLEIFLRRVFQQ